MTAPRESGEEPLVGIVDGAGSADDAVERTAKTSAPAVADVVESLEASTVVGDSRTVLDREPTFCVTVGEHALRDLVDARPQVPVLPIDADDGIHSVPSDRIDDGIEAVLADRADRCTHRLLSVVINGEQVGTGLRDLSVITAQPAQITEFVVRRSDAAVGVDAAGERTRGVQATADVTKNAVSTPASRKLLQVRADGLVVATPAGSHGYAAAADGPLLTPGAGLGVVPVAPFVTDRTSWVVGSVPLSVSISRNETPVTLRLDGRARGTFDSTDTIDIDVPDTIATLVTPASEFRSEDRT